MTDDVGQVPPGFRDIMRPTVETLKTMAHVLSTASFRHGHLPSAQSKAMAELAAEAAWPIAASTDVRLVQGALDLAGIVMIQASDCARSFAVQYESERAPIYAHMVLARAVLDACGLAYWLTDADVGAEVRAKRGVAEQLASALGREQLPMVTDTEQSDRIKGVIAQRGIGLATKPTR